jgi:hypothetical protein
VNVHFAIRDYPPPQKPAHGIKPCRAHTILLTRVTIPIAGRLPVADYVGHEKDAVQAGSLNAIADKRIPIFLILDFLVGPRVYTFTPRVLFKAVIRSALRLAALIV